MILLLIGKIMKVGGNQAIERLNLLYFDSIVNMLKDERKLIRLASIILSLMAKNEKSRENI